jgi:hypothetical protein
MREKWLTMERSVLFLALGFMVAHSYAQQGK